MVRTVQGPWYDLAMKAVIQRVSQAKVVSNSSEVSSMGRGILTLLGVCKGDNEEDVRKLVAKIIELRIFEDQNGKMNLSLKDIQGSHLIVSQFTLAAECSAGRRPSFINAEGPDQAKRLYELALSESRNFGISTFGGAFQADMQVSLTNDGPATFVLEV